MNIELRRRVVGEMTDAQLWALWWKVPHHTGLSLDSCQLLPKWQVLKLIRYVLTMEGV